MVTDSISFVGSVGVATVVSTVWKVNSFVGGVLSSEVSSSCATLLLAVVVSMGRGVVVVVVVVVIFFFFVVVLYKGFPPPVVPFAGLAVVLITKCDCLWVVDCGGLAVLVVLGFVELIAVVFVCVVTGRRVFCC